MSTAAAERWYIAAKVINASGMVRAAAYMANINEAGVATAPAGSMASGLTSPAMENPLATKTLTAVIQEARRNAIAVESGVAIGSFLQSDVAW
jgi:hypothetical protein